MLGKSLNFAAMTSLILVLAACGVEESKPSEDTTSTTSTSITWSDASTIISSKCGGTACHSSGAPYVNFVGDESMTKSVAKTAAARIRASGATKMPPSGQTDLTAGERSRLLTYLDAQ